MSSLSSSDYSQLQGIVNFLIDEFKGKGINVSLPSLRIDAFSLDVMSKVQDVRKSSLTFAPEAGSRKDYAMLSIKGSPRKIYCIRCRTGI